MILFADVFNDLDPKADDSDELIQSNCCKQSCSKIHTILITCSNAEEGASECQEETWPGQAAQRVRRGGKGMVQFAAKR